MPSQEHQTGAHHQTHYERAADNDGAAPDSSAPEDMAYGGKIHPHPGLATTLYLDEPGDANLVSVNDIRQGQLGDCFRLAVVGEVAMTQPSFISDMITRNPDGTETVRLYEALDGSLPTWGTAAYKPVYETLSNQFDPNSVNATTSFDVMNGAKEIWPQVIEKAVAQLDGGYTAISDGGWPGVAMEEMTGHAASWLSPGGVTADQLANLAMRNDLIVLDTPFSGLLPDGLVGSHAYMYEGITGTGASAAVRLGNPWGFDQPDPVLVSQLGQAFSAVEIGRLA